MDPSLLPLTNHFQFLLWGPESRPKQMEREKKSTFWDRGIKEKYFCGHFFFSLAGTGHCSQVWYVRRGPRGDCQAHRLQVRQLFNHKRVSPLQCVWYLFVLIMLNTDNIIKQTNKIILLICFPKPVIYCDQKSVTRILFGQSCLHSSFNCSIMRGKCITLPIILTSRIIEENKLGLKITQEPRTKTKKTPKTNPWKINIPHV